MLSKLEFVSFKMINDNEIITIEQTLLNQGIHAAPIEEALKFATASTSNDEDF